MKKGLKLFTLAFALMFAICVKVNAAEVSVDTLDELKDCLKTTGNTCNVTKQIDITSDIELDLNGSNIVADDSISTLFYIKNGTLDVNGKGTITARGEVFRLEGNLVAGGELIKSNLTIGKDVTAISTQDCVVFYKGNVAKVDVYGSLESKGVYATLQGNGSLTSANTVTTIYEGAVVKSSDVAIYHPQDGELTIDGTIIAESTGVEIRAGKLTIGKNAYIESKSSTFNSKLNGNGSTTSGAALAVVQHATKLDLEVVINGGTFKGFVALYQADIQKNETNNVVIDVNGGTFETTNGGTDSFIADQGVLSITGGTFNTKVSRDYVPTQYLINENGGKYIIALPTQEVETPKVDVTEEVKDITVGVTDAKETEEVLLDALKDSNIKIDDKNVYVDIEIANTKEDKLDKELVKEITTTLTEQVKGAVIGGYFEIDLNVKNAADKSVIGELTELGKTIKLSVVLPKELKEVKEGYVRTYYIVRSHVKEDGKVEVTVLDTDLSKDGNSLSFETDKFSTYALAYEDVEKVAENPNTGDNIMLFIVLGLIGLIGAIIAINKLRKNA